MSWNEIVLEIHFSQTVPFSDALLSVGAMAVTVEDADAGTAAETPVFGEPDADSAEHVWQKSRIVALLEAGQSPEEMIVRAANVAGMPATPAFTVRHVPEKDWVRETQSQFEPIHVGKHIWIVPSWCQVPDHAGTVLRLDPGLAFGTGSHPTTCLCLEWLEQTITEGCSVLDYGCGSGILAIAASRLGAKRVEGVDIDRQALETAEKNAAENQCTIPFYLPDAFANTDGQYDRIVANILSVPLQKLAPTLAARLRPGGMIVLSGILDWQTADLVAAYSPYLSLSVWKQCDGWVALTARKTEGM
ncbi:MAG: 50S ribosomal protein L11 methyltransferase [Burkholderiaceae bacterium]|nr:50S ribosomal protein L11 methyltransferase [Burkholderiaceae bacterium]